jgi:hypothetical protein
MSYEIHMIKAGNANAIALRYIFKAPGIGDIQFVAIIDGGNEEHGDKDFLKRCSVSS